MSYCEQAEWSVHLTCAVGWYLREMERKGEKWKGEERKGKNTSNKKEARKAYNPESGINYIFVNTDENISFAHA